MKGKGLVHGSAQGEALVSQRTFTFAHGVDPEKGVVTDVRSDIRGSDVRGRVLFYPFDRGSTTASAGFLEAARQGNQPAAIVTEGVDLSAVVGSVVAKLVYGIEVPVVSGISREQYSKVTSGHRVTVDADAGEVRLGE